jgi:hypothetical protein
MSFAAERLILASYGHDHRISARQAVEVQTHQEVNSMRGNRSPTQGRRL